MKQFRQLWGYLWTSLWFLPAVLVLGATILAIFLVDLDSRLDAEIWSAWPRLFGAGAAGSRGMLQVIATSMITVAGVVFSITIAALVQASSQYSPRLLRNFMRDRTNQTVLGVFVSIFVYCLVVLRTIRGGDEGAFVPSLAVLVAVGLAFVGIGFLIYFIHHIASSVQASQIVANVAAETAVAIDQLFPQRLGEAPDEEPPAAGTPAGGEVPILAEDSGYIVAVDTDALLAFARRHAMAVRMVQGIGSFAVAGTPLVTLLPEASPGAAPATPDLHAATEALNRAFTLGRQRTIDQDAAFGIRQIVDVANKALSPGINDTTTAVICIDHLTALLVRLARRHMPSPYRFEGAALRVIALGPSFASLLGNAFDEIRRNGEGNVTVLTRLHHALTLLAAVIAPATGDFSTPQTATPNPPGSASFGPRRQALLHQAVALREAVQRTVRAPSERAELSAACQTLIVALQRPVSAASAAPAFASKG